MQVTLKYQKPFGNVSESTSCTTGRPAIFGRTFKGDTVFVVYDIEKATDGDEVIYIRTAYIIED